MVRLNLLFVVAAAITTLHHCHAAKFKVRVRNLTWLQPFSPPLVVAHTNNINLFVEGDDAGDALRYVAENGNNSRFVALRDEDDVVPYLCGALIADGMVMGGDTWRGTMEVDLDICEDGIKLSMVAMLVNTNDAFVGFDSINIFPSGMSKIYPPAFDAGTEENNELCAYIPGPACEDVPGNLAAGNGEGYVHIHRGMHGIGNLSASGYDWRNPVAEVTLFPM